MRLPWQKERERSGYPLSLNQWAQQYMTYQGHSYPLYGYGPSYPNEQLEEIQANFPGYTSGGYMGNVIVFACVLARLQVFSQARFQFQQMRGGQPGDLFGTPELELLERPEPGKTTSDLLARMEVDVSLAGNSFLVRQNNRIKRLRPDWVAIVLDGDDDEPDVEVLGYAYFPGGPYSGKDPVPFQRDEIAHYAPMPDPLARYRGMSWLTPVIREIMADSGFRDHKIKFLERGGVFPHLFKVDPSSMTQDQFNQWAKAYRLNYEGENNEAKSIFLRAMVDATPLGTNFLQTDLKNIQGAGETRIASAAGVPPIVAGFSEGLEAATYSNYRQALRRFADNTVTWLWQNAAASLETIMPPPAGSRLWYDSRNIPALREDLKERAEVQQAQAVSIKTLIDAGFDPQTAVDAVQAEDMKRLQHSGLVSVQLQEPGAQANGNGNGAVPELPAPSG